MLASYVCGYRTYRDCILLADGCWLGDNPCTAVDGVGIVGGGGVQVVS